MEKITTTSREALEAGLGLYASVYGTEPESLPLTGAGSGRLYWRLRRPGHESVVYSWGADAAESGVFRSLSAVFGRHGVRVPLILGATPDGRGTLQEDLGAVDLLSLLSSDSRMELAGKALGMLARMQFVPVSEWTGIVGHAPFCPRQAMWDLNYFKYDFLKVAGIPFDEEALEDDFLRFASGLTEGIESRLRGFMYRDFQSRNVMVRDGELGFIDFQGGREGPVVYDAVSFLWQAKAGFTAEERCRLLEVYAREVESLTGAGRAEVLECVPAMAVFRTLQVLGAYGLRGLVEKKSHFIESLPQALSNLHDLAVAGALLGFPELERVALRACESRFAGLPARKGLTVKVFSFSYKKGYPEDLTGNGGGFMFDCRGMHNPGRYDRYKPLTGLDAEVREFLEETGEVQGFVDSALKMTRGSVGRYAARGFSSLQVGFGCTGGRHRSVYCAERYARLLAGEFPGVAVELEHREQGVREVFNEKPERREGE